MKASNIFSKLGMKIWLILPVFALLASCNDDLDNPVFATEELALNLSADELNLTPADYNRKMTFSWTTGNNNGTGSSISYVLEIDKLENNFANPISYELGQNTYTYDINLATLNQMVLNTFGGQVGQSLAMQSRIIASFGGNVIENQVAYADFTVTPYAPLTSQLFIVGDATSAGWGIGAAPQMVQSTTNPYEFVYSGQMFPGNFKFPVSQEGCWCQDFYTRDASDPGKMVHNIGGSGDDLQWSITDPGSYKVTVNILNLTITIAEMDAPPFEQLFIVGDASPSGWNVDNPQAFTVTDNPFVFTYEGNFSAGHFKILAGMTGDWCGQWYRPLVDNAPITGTSVAQNSGCDEDFKWEVTAAQAGRLKITLDTANNIITIQPVDVYLIGDATTNGWNMGSLVPMTKNGSVYTWSGTLVAGEMKFVKFNSGWCSGQEIIADTPNQSIFNTTFRTVDNCNGDDNKWRVTPAQASNYTITLDLNTNTLTIE